MPTPTMTRGVRRRRPAAARRPRWWRRSRGASGGRRAARAGRCAARPPRSTRTTTSRAARSALAEGRSESSSASPSDHDVGLAARRPGARRRRGRRRSAPGAARGGTCVIAASSARCSWPGTTTTTGRSVDPGGQPRQPAPVQQQVLLAAEELGAVVGERLAAGSARPRRASAISCCDDRAVDLAAHRDRRLADVHDLVVDPDRSCRPAIASMPSTRSRISDAGVGQHLGAEVRVAAGDHRRRVHDGRDPGVDERLGGGAVQVEVVEDGDVARPQPGQQGAGTPFDAGGAADAREDDAVLGAHR